MLPELAEELRSYFPAAVRDRLAAQIATHPLHREIIATVVTNEIVNRARITFVHDMRARTGRSAPEIAQAYMIVREVFELRNLWTEIEALDNKVAAQVQIEMLLEIADLVERAAGWLLYRKRLDDRPRDRQVCAERAQHRCLSVRSAAAERSQSRFRAQPPFRRSGRVRSARNPRRRDNVSRCRARCRRSGGTLGTRARPSRPGVLRGRRPVRARRDANSCAPAAGRDLLAEAGGRSDDRRSLCAADRSRSSHSGERQLNAAAEIRLPLGLLPTRQPSRRSSRYSESCVLLALPILRCSSSPAASSATRWGSVRAMVPGSCGCRRVRRLLRVRPRS